MAAGVTQGAAVCWPVRCIDGTFLPSHEAQEEGDADRRGCEGLSRRVGDSNES